MKAIGILRRYAIVGTLLLASCSDVAPNAADAGTGGPGGDGGSSGTGGVGGIGGQGGHGGAGGIAVAPVVRAPDAAFKVRDGSQVNAGGSTGLFDESGDQAMLEFPLDFEAVGSVVINVRVCDCISGVGDPTLITFRVATYEADGAPGVGDYDSGTDLEVLSQPSGDTRSFAIDVTDRVIQLRGNGASHIGLRFYDSSWAQLSVLQGSELVAFP